MFGDKSLALVWGRECWVETREERRTGRGTLPHRSERHSVASPTPRRPSLCSNVRHTTLVLEKPRVHRHPTRKPLAFQIRMVRGGRIRDSFQRCGRAVGKSQRTAQSPEFKKQSCPPLGPLGRGVWLLLGCGRVTWRGPPLENVGGAQSAPGDPTGRGPLPHEDPYLAKPGCGARVPPGLHTGLPSRVGSTVRGEGLWVWRADGCHGAQP